ncbi:MAG: 50S ribosomal protein L24 [Chthoniobacterales bacterium]
MNRVKLHVRKGDQVEVIAGNHRGSTGKVLEVLARKQRVLVEGVRMIKRHLKKSQDNPQGRIAEREGPIHLSNVKVIERTERDAKGKGKKKAAKPAAEKPKKAPKRKAADKEEA